MSGAPIFLKEEDVQEWRWIIPGQQYTLHVDGAIWTTEPWFPGKDQITKAKLDLVICNDVNPYWAAEIRKDDVVTIGQHGDLRYDVLQVSGKHAWIGLQGQDNRPPLTVEVSNLRKVK